MPYIGTSPSNGVRRVHTYTATASQTTFTGASSEGVTLSYVDTNYIDVFQNGVLLGSADYTATSGTSVVLTQSASADDLLVVIVYDIFSVADTVSKTNGGSFDSAVTMSDNLTVSGAFTSQGIDDNADATAITIDSSENVGIGNTTPSSFYSLADNLVVGTGSGGHGLTIYSGSSDSAYIGFNDTASASMQGFIQYNHNGDYMAFAPNGAERMRINSSGELLIGTSNNTPAQSNVAGAFSYRPTGQLEISSNNTQCAFFNRTTDGTVVNIIQGGSTEGTISVSGSTVSYNGGHLSRYSQLTDNTRDNTIVKGTVMTNLDQMAEWTTDGVTEDNEQLNCMAVSSVEGDANVAGVFVNWDDDDDVYTADMNVAMTGDMVIRIAQGTKVARGDLLMSAGDGTAKPQGDDIVRSKTIAKVTSTNVSHTYDDGTYLVPCVLMAC